MTREFSTAVCERIGSYVYALKDPRSGRIFYVGKGKANRMFNHAFAAIEFPLQSDKLDLIREIISEGVGVEYKVVRHGLSENEAFHVEGACIDLLGIENLTNEVRGHDWWQHGMKSADEIVQQYDAVPIIIEEPTIIININRRFGREMSAEELYQTTRHSWVVSPIQCKKAKYAIAAYRGLVREVYEIHGWTDCKNGRWEFYGEIAEEAVRNKYINQSLSNYPIQGNPIRYSFARDYRRSRRGVDEN